MKKIVALSALALAASAGSAFGQAQVNFETRILVQTITGSGAGRQIANAASNNFNVGDRVRLTVQYRITDLAGSPAGSYFGIVGYQFNVNGETGTATGTVNRSALTSAGSPAPGGTNSNGEVDTGNNSDNWANGPQYPQSGTSASTTGLHAPFRFGLNGVDSAASNGVIAGTSINAIAALQTGGATAVNQFDGQWWGLYSFEFLSTGNGLRTFSLTSNQQTLQVYRDTATQDPNSASAVLLLANQVSFGALPSVTLQFGTTNTAPVAAVTNRVITANPLVNPDASNLSLATFSDADVGNTIDVTITNDGGIGALGGVVSILGDNGATPSIVLNWDAPNAAIGQTFTVAFSYTDGTAALQSGTVTVQVIPAPGAAALLGLGGLLAARRRRA